MDTPSAYQEGFRARLAGKRMHQNPYLPAQAEPWEKWREGWRDQDEHLTGRDAALNSIGWFGR